MSVLTYSSRQILLFNGLMIGASMRALAANCILDTDVELEEKLIKWSQITYQTYINPELWVSVDDVKQWPHINNVFWLDVRQKSKIDNFPLQGALAISLNEVQDRLFFKNKPIILIGDGFDKIELEQTGIQLKKAGFKFVYALIDGVRSDLKKLNHLLSNSYIDNELTPEEFLMGSRTIQWHIITWDLNPQEIQRLPVEVMEQWISAEASLSELSHHLQSLIKNEYHRNSSSKTLIITKNSKTNQQLKNLLKNNNSPQSLLWVKGGMNYYQRFIEQQNKMLINMGIPLQSKCNNAFNG